LDLFSDWRDQVLFGGFPRITKLACPTAAGLVLPFSSTAFGRRDGPHARFGAESFSELWANDERKVVEPKAGATAEPVALREVAGSGA
jgi:hypothetical protein